MSGSGEDKHDGPLAGVYRLDLHRPKRRRILPRAPAAPNEETPAPDRNAALSMLGTFDLDDVDFRSPDEILATLDPEPTVSGPGDRPQRSPVDERAVTRDIPAVEDVQSDEILRELEEHHQRRQTSLRPRAPRGSAELDPISRRNAPPRRKREVRSPASGESKRRGQRTRVVPSLAAAAVSTATARAVTWKRWHAPRASVGEAIDQRRLRSWAIATALVLMAAVVAVVGIAPVMDSGASKPRVATRPAATRTPGSALDTAAKAVIGALGNVERRVRASQRAHRAASARPHPHRTTQARTRAVSRRRAVTSSQSAPPVAAAARTPSTSSYTSSTTSGAPTSPSPAATYTQQQAGPTSLGSQVGTGCDPTCR